MNQTEKQLPDDFSVGFGEYMAFLREGMNLSIQELSKKTGFSVELLTKVENGFYIPSKEELQVFTIPLGTSYPNLLYQAGYIEDMFASIHCS